MTSNIHNLITFFIIMFSGWIFESLFFNKKRTKHQFNARNYTLFVAGPLVAVVYAVLVYGHNVFYIYLASILLGAAAEYLADNSYSAIFGANLWRYYRLNIKGRTSWLVLPIWGAAGVAFYLLGSAIFTT